MEMMATIIRKFTLETDSAQYLHDGVCALLPLVPLPLDHASHPGRTRADEVIRIINQVCFSTHDDDRHACCIVRERARA